MGTSQHFLHFLKNSWSCTLILQVLSKNIPCTSKTPTIIPQNQMPQNPRKNKQTNRWMKSQQVHHRVTVKAKRLSVERFDEKVGMLLCRPYVLISNYPLDTCSRHLRSIIKPYTDTSAHNCSTRDRPPVSSLACIVRMHVWYNPTPLSAMESLRRVTEYSYYLPPAR